MNNSVFNDYESSDTSKLVSAKSVHIKTFSVVPITNRLGILEWVDGTEPLKSVIVREYGESFD